MSTTLTHRNASPLSNSRKRSGNTKGNTSVRTRITDDLRGLDLTSVYFPKTYNISLHHTFLLERIVKTMRTNKRHNYTKKNALESAITFLAKEIVNRLGKDLEQLTEEDKLDMMKKSDAMSKSKLGGEPLAEPAINLIETVQKPSLDDL